MTYLILKAILTGVVVVLVSEISKRSSVFAAVVASLPLTSILAFIWMYIDSQKTDAISELSYGIFWMVLPSLVFFLVLPMYLKMGVRFYPALAFASVSMAGFYFIYLKAIEALGIRI